MENLNEWLFDAVVDSSVNEKIEALTRYNKQSKNNTKICLVLSVISACLTIFGLTIFISIVFIVLIKAFESIMNNKNREFNFILRCKIYIEYLTYANEKSLYDLINRIPQKICFIGEYNTIENMVKNDFAKMYMYGMLTRKDVVKNEDVYNNGLKFDENNLSNFNVRISEFSKLKTIEVICNLLSKVFTVYAGVFIFISILGFIIFGIGILNGENVSIGIYLFTLVVDIVLVAISIILRKNKYFAKRSIKYIEYIFGDKINTVVGLCEMVNNTLFVTDKNKEKSTVIKSDIDKLFRKGYFIQK